MDVKWADAVILSVFKGHIGGCGDPPYVMIVTTHAPNKKPRTPVSLLGG